MAVQSCGEPRPAGGQEESPQTRGVRDLVRCRATGLAGRGQWLAGQGEPTGLSCASGRGFPDVTGLPVQHLPGSEPLSGVEGSGPGAGPSVPTSPAADPGEGRQPRPLLAWHGAAPPREGLPAPDKACARGPPGGRGRCSGRPVSEGSSQSAL